MCIANYICKMQLQVFFKSLQNSICVLLVVCALMELQNVHVYVRHCKK